jgi:hypothetical protein
LGRRAGVCGWAYRTLCPVGIVRFGGLIRAVTVGEVHEAAGVLYPDQVELAVPAVPRTTLPADHPGGFHVVQDAADGAFLVFGFGGDGVDAGPADGPAFGDVDADCPAVFGAVVGDDEHHAFACA